MLYFQCLTLGSAHRLARRDVGAPVRLRVAWQGEAIRESGRAGLAREELSGAAGVRGIPGRQRARTGELEPGS
jgi:hypothetical protein